MACVGDRILVGTGGSGVFRSPPLGCISVPRPGDVALKGPFADKVERFLARRMLEPGGFHTDYFLNPDYFSKETSQVIQSTILAFL